MQPFIVLVASTLNILQVHINHATPFPEWSRQEERTFCSAEQDSDTACEDRSEAAKVLLKNQWDRISEAYKTLCVEYMADPLYGNITYKWTDYEDLSHCIAELQTHDARFK